MDEASGWRVAYGCVYPAPERSGAFWLLISNCSYVLPANRQEKRRGWDSNPRDGSTPPTRFPVALLRPTRTPLQLRIKSLPDGGGEKASSTHSGSLPLPVDARRRELLRRAGRRRRREKTPRPTQP